MGITLKSMRNLASSISRRHTGDAALDHDRDMRPVARELDRSSRSRVKRPRLAKPENNVADNAVERRQVVVTTEVVVTVDTTISVFVALDTNGVATATSTLNPVPTSALPRVADVPSVAVVNIPVNTVVNTPAVVPNAVTPTTVVNMVIPSTDDVVQVAATTALPLPAVVSSLVNTLPLAPTLESILPTSVIADLTAAASPVSVAIIPSTSAPPISATVEGSAATNATAVSSTTTSASLSATLLNANNTTANSTITSSTLFPSLLASNLSTALLNATYTPASLTSTDFGLSSIISTTFASSLSESTNSPVAVSAGGRAASGASGNSGSSGQSGSNANNDSNGSSTEAPPPPVIAGAVTGSVGAAAIFIVLLWFFLRWYKRRTSGSNALGAGRSLDRLDAAGNRSDPAMTEHSRFLPAAAATFLSRHRHRASSPTLPSSEQGFHKVAGRKMPSQFGMDLVDAPMSRDFDTDRQQRHRSMFSDAAALRESQLSDAGARFAYDPEIPAERETFMPSPARTPVIHSSNPFMAPHEMSDSPSHPHSASAGDSPFRRSRSTRFSEGLTIL